MSGFYPPYQFIPVTGTIDGDRDAHRFDYADIAAGACDRAPTVRHDLWHKDGLSGRLICAAHLDTPTLVGGVHKPQVGNRPVQVPQYEWRGKPALPANSLRGMISSVAEALSQSALRVLSRKRWGYLVDADSGEPPDQYGKVKKTMQLTLSQHLDKIDGDLKPWNEDRRKHGQVTPAELLFGIVEVNEKGESRDSAGNLAGRLRFRDALLVGQPKPPGAEITLRLLGSPNQPCPSMYYHLEGQRGAYLSKQDYRHHENDTRLYPNGRKCYLHHPEPAAADRTDWESNKAGDRQDKSRMRCRPMAADQWFFFPIDFDNLSAAELTLLLRALTPSPGFRHRLGLGKPLGLGTVAVTVEGVFLIERARRYDPDDLFDPERCYHRVWRPQRPKGGEAPPDWSGLYPDEQKALHEQPPSSAPADLADERLIDQDTLAHLRALGDADRLEPGLPVRTPLLDNQYDPEHETYKWFDTNDRESPQGHQAMPAIDPDESYLPCLYGDMAEARGSGRFRDADFSALPPRLLAVVGGLPPHQNLNSQGAVLRSKQLAEAIRDLAKTDRSHAEAVFEALNSICEREELFFVSKAEKIYDALEYRYYYKRS